MDDKKSILSQEWDRSKELIIFDDLHKMPKWKSWLKGIYNKEGTNPNLLVTGSARLDTFKKTGDSLAGRHFYFRLHPFDAKELAESNLKKSPDQVLKTILTVGGYPEPSLENDIRFYNRWKKTHLDLILKQDLFDFQIVRDVQSIELLIELFRSRVASGVSVNALATQFKSG